MSPSPNSNPGVSGYNNQTYTVEFTVPGNLDGSTLGPEIVVPSPNDDPQSIYRPDVPGNLGLIDVDYVVEATGDERLGTRGARIVHVVWIDSPVATAGGSITVGDNVDGTFTRQETIDTIPGGATQFYRDQPFLVPQGSILQLSGFINNTSNPIKVRLTIEYVESLSLAQQAICTCEGGTRGATGATGATGAAGGSANIALLASTNTLTNTTTETSILSAVIPANTLQTRPVNLELFAPFSVLSQAGGEILTFRLNLGATEMGSLTIDISDLSMVGQFVINLYGYVYEPASGPGIQLGRLRATVDGPSTGGTQALELSGSEDIAAVEDFTTALTIEITAQFSAATTDLTMSTTTASFVQP